MTLGDLLSAARRYWLILALGVLLTLGAGVVVWRAPGVYWASAKLYFLAPASAWQPNQIAPDSSVGIGFAGLIQTEINGGVPPRRATSPDVSIVDEGIYDGWSVFLPNYGGQWATNFSDSVLVIQASGPTAEVVHTRMAGLLDKISRLVTAREDAADVPLANRVQLTMSPSSVAVQYSNGHRSRAVGVIVLLGVLLSFTACRIADRVSAPRRRGESGRRGEPTDDGISDARVRDAAGGHQDGTGRQGAESASGVAADRGGDRAAP